MRRDFTAHLIRCSTG